MATAVQLEALSAAALPAAHADLVTLLTACVHAGASIGFLAPLADPEAAAYWHGLAPQVESGGRTLLVARDGASGAIVGSGQLAFESRPNGRHRAEVCKVMVLPSHRRRGIAARIMHELERLAHDRAIRLLFLDTSEGAGGACGFYETLGYTYAGGIPGYALDPDGRPAKNAIYFKQLDTSV
jgi:acetyltransferase